MSSTSPFGGSLYGILVFVLYLRFWGLGGIFILGNSKILVIASEAKQSLGILDLVLGILEFRHCERSEAISRKSKFILREF